MKPLATFYDTLQVARSANESVIRAAYKTLCQKYHPDKNPDDVDGATQDMLLLNKAYEVLSDEEKRLAYDLWITKREREMRAQEEREAAEAEARKPMFPPIEMPPEPSGAPTPASFPQVPPPAAPKPPSASPTSPAQTPKASVPTAVARPPAEQPGFADTQPQVAEKPAVSGSAPRAAVAHPLHALREPQPPSAVADAVDWLRERPVWLLSTVLAVVLLIAFAPWLKQVSLGGSKPTGPITPDLQPTYVEPAATAPSSIPAALPTPDATPQVIPVANDDKPVRNAKPHAVAQRRTAIAKKPPEPEAPAKSHEPATAPPLDPGGHSGFAPKCRWVTPTRWSCD